VTRFARSSGPRDPVPDACFCVSGRAFAGFRNATKAAAAKGRETGLCRRVRRGCAGQRPARAPALERRQASDGASGAAGEGCGPKQPPVRRLVLAGSLPMRSCRDQGGRPARRARPPVAGSPRERDESARRSARSVPRSSSPARLPRPQDGLGAADIAVLSCSSSNQGAAVLISTGLAADFAETRADSRAGRTTSMPMSCRLPTGPHRLHGTPAPHGTHSPGPASSREQRRAAPASDSLSEGFYVKPLLVRWL